MSYVVHFNLLLDAFFRAVPAYKARQISMMAGNGHNWISDFRRAGAGTFAKADSVVDVIRDHCPQGPAGDEVRAILSALDAVRDEKPDEDAA